MSSSLRSWVGWLGVAVLTAAACAPKPRGAAAESLSATGATAPGRNDVAGLPNFGQVDEGLWRSAQPSAEGFASAHALGVRTVLCLRSTRDDARLAAQAGLELVRVPMRQWNVDEAELQAALEVACDPARRPVLVHCAHGRDRTGAVVAAYRRVVQGWSAEEAVREMRAYGAAPWWINLPRLVRRLDVERLRAALRLPAPAGPGAPK